jgi:aminoglycoside 2''-phosphotransferase
MQRTADSDAATGGTALPPREMQALVRRHATLATPEPRYLSPDLPEVGAAFLGYPLIAGEPRRRSTLDALAVQDDAAPVRRMAEQLATFLKALHSISADAIKEALPGEATGFRPLDEWDDLYARIRRLLFPHMRSDARAAVAARFEAFLAGAAPPTR